MSLRPCTEELKSRASLPQNFPLNSLERRAAVERSLFEPAERRPAPRETDSESSQRLPEQEFQIGQLGPLVVMTRPREMPECFEGIDSSGEADSPLMKNPAHQQERPLPLAL